MSNNEPVVVVRGEVPGLRMRMLADRDAGQVIWETEYLSDLGEVTGSSVRRLCSAELIHLEEVMKTLLRARKAMTPRRRPDRTRLVAPPAVSIGET